MVKDIKGVSDPMRFFLINMEYVSIYNMTESEINESIVDDLLHLHFNFEMKSCSIKFLCRFLQHDDFLTKYIQDSINKLIKDELIELIGIEQIRINPMKYQIAMDFCGCWYDGYEIPNNINIVKLTDYGKQLIENNNIDDVSNYLTEQFLLENSGIGNHEEITDV